MVGDIYTGSAWKTILVGGLNWGGQGYYALDITDPNNPVALWEFTDANMGLTYGNPVITKRADGTWVVAISSGYNNTTGDGKGRIYLINATTGALLTDSVRRPSVVGRSPSGLGKINAWVDNAADNTAKRFYGGDMLGNLWRFDFDDLVPPSGAEATKLANFQVGEYAAADHHQAAAARWSPPAMAPRCRWSWLPPGATSAPATSPTRPSSRSTPSRIR